MQEDAYRLEGTVVIPEDKKDEFNEYILRILDKCGIRKTDKMELGGQIVTVVRQPMPDEQGIVHFDYSIFEKKIRKQAEYNMNTCELKTPDRGYSEFGIVMNMIMVMQESYSEDHCYFMFKDRPGRVDVYALLIKGVLGIRLEFPNRAKMWDMLFFLKNTEKYQSITSKIIWDAYPFDFCDSIPEQFFAVFDIDSENIQIPKEPFEGEKAEIKTASKFKLSYYVYQNMKKFIKNKEEESLKKFLKILLDADLQKRQKLTENIRYGVIAEVSLYVLPPIIVRGYALAVQINFWDAWKALGIKGYSEILVEKESLRTAKYEEDERYIPLYKAIQKDYEDEFIEFWEDDDLYFSDDMKKCLSDWKERFMEIKLEDDFNVEIFLAQIITELDHEWGCRLVDRKFVTEFMEHKNDDNYKKALLFYREFMDRDCCYFPELTRKQAIRWVIRNNRRPFDFTAMDAFQSLLINHKYRYEILGF
ncbi:MAG: hypothetical protein HDR23_01410 [Lachnospiraceae bacterium]|nr:hypothetical protein [Lachnospiraceae bacterium]